MPELFGLTKHKPLNFTLNVSTRNITIPVKINDDIFCSKTSARGTLGLFQLYYICHFNCSIKMEYG